MNEPRSCCGGEENEDVSRSDVRNFYSKAAVSAQESLCCPTQYDSKDLSHIPKEVLEISYGCGSPVGRANLREGEVMVDLGSGGGIDCFIAARHVGKTGRIYGIDMTEEMLGVARKNATLVAKNLGYNNIEFRQGYLESIPVDDSSVDLVTSNCVINLSTDKDEVFGEIHRILKPGGRFMISDIISDKEVSEAMQTNKELWGECVSGALTLNKFLSYAKKNRFQGLRVQKDYLWKEVEGIKFYSYTIEGCKHVPSENKSFCSSLLATYAGPFESVTFQGTVYPVGIAVEINEDTAQLLASHSYAGQIIITNPTTEKPAEPESSCCG
jgi:ubiquinone/menaquinone biosynthesis C-methylase UbiE